MQSWESHTHQELITLVCWYNLKQILIYKLSRVCNVNDTRFILECSVEYHTHYQKAHLPVCVSVQHTTAGGKQLMLAWLFTKWVYPWKGRNMVNDPEKYVARLENMRNQIPGKDEKSEERNQHNKKKHKKIFIFHSSQWCITILIICNNSFSFISRKHRS